MKESLRIMPFYRQKPSETINLSSKGRIQLSQLPKGLLLPLMVLLSWFSYQTCNWISFFQSPSAYSRTHPLKFVSLNSENFWFLRIKICFRAKAMRQFSLSFSCLSVVTIWLLNEHMEGSTGYRSLLCKLHSIDAMMDRLDWPSTFHMYDSQHESEKRCTGIRPLDKCIICTFYLNSNHQKLTNQNQFEQALDLFLFCCFLMEGLELRLWF